jgi:hypothetical protein
MQGKSVYIPSSCMVCWWVLSLPLVIACILGWSEGSLEVIFGFCPAPHKGETQTGSSRSAMMQVV